MRCFLLILLSFLFSNAIAQSTTKFFGLRSGTNLSIAEVTSNSFNSEAEIGGRLGFVYTEDYFSTGFDIESFLALRRTELDTLLSNMNIPVIGFAGRFRIYTSSRKKFNFHLGYQMNLNLVEEGSWIESFTTGAELGAAYNLTNRWAIELSIFFPASKSGDLKWTTDQVIEDQVQTVETSEDIYIHSILLSVRYHLFERY